MTATTAPTGTTAPIATDARTRRTSRRTTGEQGPSRAAALLERWSAARRRRQYLVEKQRFDARDRSDRYIDGPDPTYGREVLIRFVQH